MLTLSIKVRNLLSLFSGIPNSQQTQIAVLNDNIEWAKREKRIFLKQSLETRLISLYVSNICRFRLLLSLIIVVFARQLETQQHKPALVLIETLLTELRRLDDKMILTEVHLLESRVYRGIGNLAKAKVRASHATCLHT
jgi:26S proteasome regulatory subunit N6